MAWTTPRTWAAGEVLTAALMNQQLKENLNALLNGTAGMTHLVAARGTDASMPASDAVLQLSGTYTGTAAEFQSLAYLSFTDQRTTQNLFSTGLRLDYTRSASATQVPTNSDAAIYILPAFNQSLSTIYSSLHIAGASVAASMTMTDLRAIRIQNASGSGAVTTQYGLYVETLNKGSTNYAIYTNTGDLRFGGNLGFFGATPVARGALALPTGTIKRTTYATGTVTLAELAGVVMAIITDMRLFGLFS